jgi:hypothetical protein
MLSVYQHWDPLKVCLVGRSYPPEFYSFIKNSKVRSVMERIAIETEEDYQKLITLLEKFGVEIIRTDVSDDFDLYLDERSEKYYPPPMCPRDYTGMFGTRFFAPDESFGKLMKTFERLLDTNTFSGSDFVDLIVDFGFTENQINNNMSKEEIKVFLLDFYNTLKVSSLAHPSSNPKFDSYKTVKEYVRNCGNEVILDNSVNTAVTTRIGKDLIHGSVHEKSNLVMTSRNIKKYFSEYRNHIVREVSGHTDASFCPVKPGLILSLNGLNIHSQTFPGWETVFLPGESWQKVDGFLKLKEKNKGKWWVPGEELNDDFTDFVESWLNDWVYYVEETVFDVNILVIDEHNAVCNGYNKNVFDAFERHGITPHIINFRHRYFWDGGLHCITSDLNRIGEQKDYFPDRDKKVYVYEKRR